MEIWDVETTCLVARDVFNCSLSARSWYQWISRKRPTRDEWLIDMLTMTQLNRDIQQVESSRLACLLACLILAWLFVSLLRLTDRDWLISWIRYRYVGILVHRDDIRMSNYEMTQWYNSLSTEAGEMRIDWLIDENPLIYLVRACISRAFWQINVNNLHVRGKFRGITCWSMLTGVFNVNNSPCTRLNFAVSQYQRWPNASALMHFKINVITISYKRFAEWCLPSGGGSPLWPPLAETILRKRLIFSFIILSTYQSHHHLIHHHIITREHHTFLNIQSLSHILSESAFLADPDWSKSHCFVLK